MFLAVAWSIILQFCAYNLMYKHNFVATQEIPMGVNPVDDVDGEKAMKPGQRNKSETKSPNSSRLDPERHEGI